jgi:hypothetical protein
MKMKKETLFSAGAGEAVFLIAQTSCSEKNTSAKKRRLEGKLQAYRKRGA